MYKSTTIFVYYFLIVRFSYVRNAIILAIFPTGCHYLQESREKTMKSREKIVALLAEDGKLSAVALAGKVGISAKAVEKHLANLKADGIIERIGPAKGGHWKVRQ